MDSIPENGSVGVSTRSKFSPQPLQTTQRSNRDVGQHTTMATRRFVIEPVETSRRSNRDENEAKKKKEEELPTPVETSVKSNRTIEEQQAQSRRVVPEPIDSSRRNNYSTQTAKSRFLPQPVETSNRTNRTTGESDPAKPRYLPQPVETTRRSNVVVVAAVVAEPRRKTTRGEEVEVEPTPLTTHALTSFLSSLPQPISTTRFSNRDDPHRYFSDRDSRGCPSLSSSPVSTTSSASCSGAAADFLPSRDDLHHTPSTSTLVNGDSLDNIVNSSTNKQIDTTTTASNANTANEHSHAKETPFQEVGAPAIRSNTREFPERDSSFDHANRSHEIAHQQHDENACTQEQGEVRQKHSHSQTHQFALQNQQRLHLENQRKQLATLQAQSRLPPRPASKSNAPPPRKKKPLVPFTFIGASKSKPVMMLDIENQVLASPLPTTRYFESSSPNLLKTNSNMNNITVDYFTSKPAVRQPTLLSCGTAPGSPISNSRSTSNASSSNETNITIPPTCSSSKPTPEDTEIFTEPQSTEDDTNLCPTTRAEVTTEFVQMVYTYASLNHESIGKKFDEELVMGCGGEGKGWTMERVRLDRFEALREYVGGYVEVKPHVVAGKGYW